MEPWNQVSAVSGFGAPTLLPEELSPTRPGDVRQLSREKVHDAIHTNHAGLIKGLLTIGFP